ncbi:hypothetical protein HYV21_01475 [Candidatus Microgenomates bacterium]|nr:hypothetical protein [Candidatus Microgenomates bacterium]
MRIEQKPSNAHNFATHRIYVEQGEDPRQILRAIAVASFELARPIRLGWLAHDGGAAMTPEDADQFIGEWGGKLSLSMDYVQGRQVKTGISQEADGSFTFNTGLFEVDRGEPNKMFARAQEILSGFGSASLPVEVVSTRQQYQGKSLDLRLEGIGYKRLDNEGDLEFRNRVFPSLFREDRLLAFEFLFGQSAAEWDDKKKKGLINFMLSSLLTDDALKQFSQTFTG